MKVLLIGWDGADWKVIHPLLDAGRMPNLERLISEGVMGNLATLYPSLSPMLWTSIATGKRPFKHRVLGFIEPDPSGEGVRPVSSLTRQCRAIWNIFTLLNKRSIVVGWWPSHPCEPILGVMVSNHYQKATAPYGKPWPLPEGAVHPVRLSPILAKLRIHPQEVPVEMMLNFLPKLPEMKDEKYARRIECVAKIIAENLSINRAITAILDYEQWDFAAVYYDAIDHFSHGFMNYHPPKLSWMKEEDFELYKNVVSIGYEFQDFLLGTLLKRVDNDTLVILVSDHGFHSDHLRPRFIPPDPAGPAVQHRHYGIFVAKGPNIKKDEIVYGATILDITPTILAALNLPVGEDMDGKVLLNIFQDPPNVDTIPSWEEREGYDGRVPEYARLEPEVQEEVIKQLVELGYIENPDANQKKAVKEAIREWQYNEARSYIDAGMHIKVVPILENLCKKFPDEFRFKIKLIECYLALNRIEKAKETLAAAITYKKEIAKKARRELRIWLKRKKNKKPEEWTLQEKRDFRKLRAKATLDTATTTYLQGVIAFKERKYEKALKFFEKVSKIQKNKSLSLLMMIGESYLSLRQWEKACKIFEECLERDPENAKAMAGLAEALLGLRKNCEALEWAFEAVGLQFHFPQAHFIIGVALHRLGFIREAIEALKIATHQNPNFIKAYQRLAYIYKRRLKNFEKAKEYKEAASRARNNLRELKKGKIQIEERKKMYNIALTSDLIKDPVEAPFDIKNGILIVSGLPRSGTSMMMQMLKAGGLIILTDNKRAPDESNPRGYYEYEKVKNLRKDTSWLSEACGKAVKIVAPLITYLPLENGFQYRVIFMMRNLEEVIESQRKMLARKEKRSLNKSVLKRTYMMYLQQAMAFLRLAQIPTLFVDYYKVLNDPLKESERIAKFLGLSIKAEEMAKVVDPNLYRERIN